MFCILPMSYAFHLLIISIRSFTSSRYSTMKKTGVFIFLFLSCQFVFGQWSSAQLSEAKYDLNALSHADKLYFVGGNVDGNIGTNVIDVYSNSTDTWSTLLAPETLVALNRNVIIQNKIYAQVEFERFLIYDINAETWSELEVPNHGGVHVTSMDEYLIVADTDDVSLYNTLSEEWSSYDFTRRDGASLTAGNGKLFIAGGIVSGDQQDLVEILDLNTGEWTSGLLSIPRENVKSIVLNDKVYFAGGQAADFARVGRIDIYDVENDIWTIDSLSVARWDFAISVFEDKLFFVGGQVFDFFDQYVNVIDVYDTKWQFWQTLNLPTGRAELASTVHQGRLFCAGGESDSNDRESIVEIYDLDELSGIDEQDMPKLNVYPNPSQDYVNIESEIIISSLEVVDIYGQRIFTKKGINDQNFKLDVESYHPGVYFVRINGNSKAFPFVKD